MNAGRKATATKSSGAPGRIMDALRRAVRTLRQANQTARRELGVSAAQLFVLRQIAELPGLSLSDLAARTHTAQSSVSEVVSRLVAGGLILRSVSTVDKRRVRLALTPVGESITARATSTIQERLIGGLGHLSDAERARLADSLEAWLAAAGLEKVPPTMFFESGKRSRQTS